jgi:hypothetical protein
VTAFHCELCKRPLDQRDDQHFGTTWWTPDDVIREAKENFGVDMTIEDAIALLRPKFDYLRDIMIEAAMPEVQKMIERHLKSKKKVG